MFSQFKRIAVGATILIAAAASPAAGAEPLHTSFIKLDQDITLRRSVVRPARPKATVLLLHGFPETLQTWEQVVPKLAADYEVHAFDWPGYGQSSRPSPGTFAYAPHDYVQVLRAYVAKSRIDRSKLIIYATDIGALPALLAAIDQPDIARTIIVGDFAPFNRPQWMHPRLERLKTRPAADLARAELNADPAAVLGNAFNRGLPPSAQIAISPEFRADMTLGWNHGQRTTGDAFYHYYAHFTRDQDRFEANLNQLKTPVKIMWGAADPYISKDMGLELGKKLGVDVTLLPGTGHYPHLQFPDRTVDEIRAAASSTH